MPAVLLRKLKGVLAGLLKIVPKLDEFRTLRAHGGILLRAVAPGHHDVHRHVEPAPGQRQRLSVISARGGDQS